MSIHSVSAMTGLKLPKRRAKGKVTDHLVAANQHLAAVNHALTQTKTVSALDLANALIGGGSTKAPAKASPAKASPAKMSSSKPSSGRSQSAGVVSAKGWHPAKITDAPDTFQGKAGTTK